MSERLIDANALIKSMKSHTVEDNGLTDDYKAGLTDSIRTAVALAENASTIDAVPVVRCRECKSHGTLKGGELFCGKIKTGIYGYCHTVKADDYCSYGAKMEDKP